MDKEYNQIEINLIMQTGVNTNLLNNKIVYYCLIKPFGLYTFHVNE
jgi:hypothetical protein